MNDAEFQALAERVGRLEDERAIQAHLTRYGFAVDSDSVDQTMALYAENCRIDIDNAVFMNGREATRGIVDSEAHQAILPNCAHIMGPFVVQLDGDHAVATGYGTVFVKENGVAAVWRQSYGRWELEKRDGKWEIAVRISRSIGRDDAQDLLRRAL